MAASQLPESRTPPNLFGKSPGSRAVVTGSSSGIGRAIALELAAAGADLILHARQSRDALEAVAEEIRGLGRQAHCELADFSDPAECERFSTVIWDKFPEIDVWVNNAGADLLTGEGRQLDYAAKLRRLLDVDVISTLLLSRSAGRRMQALGRGALLNIGWDQADRGMEGDSGELFAASKNAIMGFTRSLAVSLAPQVRVNCIAPGWIRTAWGETASDAWQQRVLKETPLQRWGTPEDIAQAARFLVSPQASFITGQIINVNGGAVR